jgi:hypothetical protein
MTTTMQNERQRPSSQCSLGLLVETQPQSKQHSGLRVECLYCKASWQLRLLVSLVPNRAVTPQHFAAMDELIAALPLTSGEFAVSQGRIINAARYYRAGEIGAAGFELRLLSHCLQPRPVIQRPRRYSSGSVSVAKALMENR